jgi:intracellular multiplication protein IcmD
MKFKHIMQVVGFLFLLLLGSHAFAISGIGSVASQVTTNFKSVAKLVTAGSYLAGMGFGVAALVKFKAHKDNPTQITIGMPIVLLFVSAALLFVPSVFSSTGQTLFGSSGDQAGISGIYSF